MDPKETKYLGLSDEFFKTIQEREEQFKLTILSVEDTEEIPQPPSCGIDDPSCESCSG